MSNGQAKYDGEFKYNLPSGKGKYDYENGDIYEGSFLAGNKDGQGKFFYGQSKDRYEG